MFRESFDEMNTEGAASSTSTEGKEKQLKKKKEKKQFYLKGRLSERTDKFFHQLVHSPSRCND